MEMCGWGACELSCGFWMGLKETLHEPILHWWSLYHATTTGTNKLTFFCDFERKEEATYKRSGAPAILFIVLPSIFNFTCVHWMNVVHVCCHLFSLFRQLKKIIVIASCTNLFKASRFLMIIALLIGTLRSTVFSSAWFLCFYFDHFRTALLSNESGYFDFNALCADVLLAWTALFGVRAVVKTVAKTTSWECH